MSHKYSLNQHMLKSTYDINLYAAVQLNLKLKK